MDIVPPPSEDQMPGSRRSAEHPDIEIASPADSHVGMWACGRLTGGKILVVKFGLCQLLDRLDELLASG
jgi:hypothetical protein